MRKHKEALLFLSLPQPLPQFSETEKLKRPGTPLPSREIQIKMQHIWGRTQHHTKSYVSIHASE